LLDDPTRNLHMEIAQLVFGPTATDAHKYRTKRGVFGRLYGGGIDAIMAGVGVGQAQAQALIDAMDAILPTYAGWAHRTRQAVKAGHTKFPTYSGRVVHLDQAWPHKAPNYLIQGTARELLIDALERWQQTPWSTCTLLPVHDEIVVQVPALEAEAATAALQACMTSTIAGVPILSEASAPTYAWADSE
jgi:DNA polymerase I-like protein with 3'-5' exonuclease and polymerase domains